MGRSARAGDVLPGPAVRLDAVGDRLDPGVVPFRKAHSFEVHVSGGEYNVAVGLSDCFGMKAGIATAMVRYGIGDLAGLLALGERLWR